MKKKSTGRNGVVVFVPTSGLCNRMRAIASAINLSDSLSKKLEVVWHIDYGSLACPFGNLFKPITSAKIIHPRKISQHFYQDEWYFQKGIQNMNTFKKLALCGSSWAHKRIAYDLVVYNSEVYRSSPTELAHRVKGKHKVLVVTDKDFYNDIVPSSYSMFEPIDELQKQISVVTADFNNHTIGVHIRRGDNKLSISKSPLILFQESISYEIEKNPKANFYVASDSISDKLSLKKMFKERIITDLRSGTRNNVTGMQSALVDLYSLSRTNKIYGSYWSSFSDVASKISNIPLSVLSIAD
jgi:hypothetical protein